MTHCITLKHYQPTAGALSSTGLRPMVFSAFFDKTMNTNDVILSAAKNLAFLDT
jgi:hypothetical protein